MSGIDLTPIAYIRTALGSKFGVPRQSGLVPGLTGVIQFDPEFRQPDALRGLESVSHIWLIWVFSEAIRDGWSATVRPPRLGGNEHVGVFATRSPFRPNPIGLSCVRVERVDVRCCELHVSGVDLVDRTPILDIKPYVPYADAVPDADAGFASMAPELRLQVRFDASIPPELGADDVANLQTIIGLDPRPRSRPDDEERMYGFPYKSFDVRFRVRGGEATVVEFVRLS